MNGQLDRRHALGLGAATAVSLVSGALAQTLNRPARVLVGFPPGGSVDTVARLLVEQMKDYASSLIVENRAGAGGRLALDGLRRSDGDGATFAMTPGDQIALFPHIYRKLSYDPQRDFAPVSTVCSFPFVVAVGPMVPAQVRTLADFVAWCRANPERASFGSAGAGTRPHFLGLLLAREAKTGIAHIPFNGGAPAMQAVIGGQIPAVVTVLGSVLAQLQGGALRALATTSPQRTPLLPDLPTARESGFTSVEAVEWFGVFLPSSTPATQVERLRQAVQAAAAVPSVKASLASQGYDGTPVSGETLVRLIRGDTDRWAAIVAESGFNPLE
jgi:tripartite-type tricarboxylate transporter receptor subunit TctC